MKCKCGMEYKTEYNDTCPRCGAEPASQSEFIEPLEAGTTREADITEDGITFDIRVKDCPLINHCIALDLKPVECVAGIQTNMQGAVITKSCKHYRADSAKISPAGTVTICCGH